MDRRWRLSGRTTGRLDARYRRGERVAWVADPDGNLVMLTPVAEAALAAAHTEIVDDLVRLFDQALAGTDSRARDRVAVRKVELVAADVGRLMLLDEMLDAVLDTDRDHAAA